MLLPILTHLYSTIGKVTSRMTELNTASPCATSGHLHAVMPTHTPDAAECMLDLKCDALDSHTVALCIAHHEVADQLELFQ